MTKRVLMNQLFIMVCAVVENKDTPYKLGVKLLEKALNNDMSYLDELPDSVSNDFTEMHQDIYYMFNLLNEKERKMIIENIYKETYLMLQNVDKAYNEKLPYVERARAKYTATVKQILVNVIMAYIGEGVSLKPQYESFQSDYENYAKVHMGPISKIADSQNRLGLKETIVRREAEADLLIEKYRNLNLTKSDLRTPLEDEWLWRDNISVAV
jgi:hypothetical protein